MATQQSGGTVSVWFAVVPAVIAGLAVVASFWSLQSNLTGNYLTIREHQEFKDRADKTIADLRSEVENHLRTETVLYLSRSEFDRWIKERDSSLALMRDNIARLENSRPTTAEVAEVSRGLAHRIDRLERLLLPPRTPIDKP